MLRSYKDILSQDYIDFILNLPEVIKAKENIDTKVEGSIYFNVHLTNVVKEQIFNKLQLDLSNVDKVPMRWIKGDTLPHVDRGVQSFDNTYLIYLTDSEGELLLDNNSFPIQKNSAYIFNEGVHHETVNTGLEPRLLLGPMNEEGFAVGGPLNFNYPGGTIVYLRDTAGFYEYSLDQTNWNNFYFPVEVTNTDTSLGLVTIEFTTDFTIFNNDSYFICSSSHIQFGSKSLRNDGTRPQITIDGVTNYDGLIENGDNLVDGYSNIYIFNLEILAINGSTTYSSGIDSAGWLCQAHFGKVATNNYIINCSSDGPISEDCGGIVGANSGSGLGAVLTIIGCSSSGIIEEGAGGIVGTNAGINSGSVICKSCWSTGLIQERSGGIFSIDAGRFTGYVEAKNCYSTGSINFYGGGIFGFEAGNNNGTVVAENCYSLGDMNTDAGGIFGTFAGRNSGSTNAINCYSNGVVNTSGNGIYGTNKQAGAQTTNCYIANNSWNNTTANSSLIGTPNPIIGTTWVYNGVNEPYELYNMGYTPYTLLIINEAGDDFIESFEQTILPNSSTTAGVKSGTVFEILSIQGGDPDSYSTISIDTNTGAISTLGTTVSGTYDVYIRSTGSYNISLFNLIVQSFIPCLTADTIVLTPVGYRVITELQVGDDVTTPDNRNVKIKYINKSIIKRNKLEKYPYIIPKDSIDVDYPKIETRLSGDHLIKYNNIWIHPAQSKRFTQDLSKDTVEYYHIELENYDIDHLVINDGLIVESFSGFDNRINLIIYRMRVKPPLLEIINSDS